MRVSDTPIGRGGNGLSGEGCVARPLLLDSTREPWLPEANELVVLTTRCSSRLLGVTGVCGMSESSLEVTEEVGLYVNVGREITVTCRRRETATVASAAISRASV